MGLRPGLNEKGLGDDVGHLYPALSIPTCSITPTTRRVLRWRPGNWLMDAYKKEQRNSPLLFGGYWVRASTKELFYQNFSV